MSPLLWLALTVIAGIGAYLVGWPAWSSSRSRQSRDLNAERYLAWRGRAPRGAPPAREGLTGEERRRLMLAAALVAVAVIGVVAFFVTS